MSGSLARRVSAVVAAKTVTRNVDVIEVRWKPPDGRMTIVAVVATADMRGVLARCRYAIVTRAAAADYLSVVDSNNRRPKIDRVTIFANI